MPHTCRAERESGFAACASLPSMVADTAICHLKDLQLLADLKSFRAAAGARRS